MALAPFAAPSLAQVTAVQTALAWSIAGEASAKQVLREANRAVSDQAPLAASALIALVLGNLGYLFRYRSDPADFARLVIPAPKKIGADFEVTKGWVRRKPLMIAYHETTPKTVESRFFINVHSLVPVAARGGEYMEAAELSRKSDAVRLMEILLWAGIGVFPAENG